MPKRTFWGVELPSDDDEIQRSPSPAFTLPSGPPQELLNLIESAKPDSAGVLTTPMPPRPPPPPRRPVADESTFGRRPGVLRFLGGLPGWHAVFVEKTHDCPRSPSQ